MAEAIAGLLGFVGVLVGALVTSRSADRKWIRELKLRRYNHLVHQIDEGQKALVAYVKDLAAPDHYHDYASFRRAHEVHEIRVADAMRSITDTSAELSVYAAVGVRARTLAVMHAWETQPRKLMPLAKAFDEACPATSQEGVSSEGSHERWPNEAVRGVSVRIGVVATQIDNSFSTQQRELVSRIRADLGVDLLSPWRRFAWWRADRRALAEFSAALSRSGR